MKLPMDIDIQFDMRSDGGNNPDKNSATLRKYHQILWSRKLPNGKVMDLDEKLVWKDIHYSSDTLTNCFKKYINNSYASHFKGNVWKQINNENTLYEEYQKICNTIGGFIIFPTSNSINSARGTKPKICDRVDLTLECIRRYYNRERSPLSTVLKKNSDFFKLFKNFKEYVDFFFLQDLLEQKKNGQLNYKKVKIIFGNKVLPKDPKKWANALPTTVQEWQDWRNGCIDFVRNRNKRILEYICKCENEQLALNLKNTLDILNQKCDRCKKQLSNLKCIFYPSDIADILSRQYDYLVKLDATAVQNVFKDDMDKYKNYLKNIKSIK